MVENKELINKSIIQDNDVSISEFEEKKSILNENKESFHSKEKENYVKFLCKKKEFFKVENIEEIKNKKLENINSKEGRWTEDEHNKFLEGLVKYGTVWKKIKTLIKTRTSVQVRSHAQKFYLKMKSCKDESLGIDFTLDSINSIKDMISQIKSINSNYDIINIFKYLNNKYENIKKTQKSTNIKNKDNKDNNSLNEDTYHNEKINDEGSNKNYNCSSNNIIENQNNQFNLLEKNKESLFINQQINSSIINNINNSYNNNFPLFNNLLLINNNQIINSPTNLQNIGQLKNSFNNPLLNNYVYNINNQNCINNNFLLYSISNPNTRVTSFLNDYLVSLRPQNILNYNINNNSNIDNIYNLNYLINNNNNLVFNRKMSN